MFLNSFLEEAMIQFESVIRSRFPDFYFVLDYSLRIRLDFVKRSEEINTTRTFNDIVVPIQLFSILFEENDTILKRLRKICWKTFQDTQFFKYRTFRMLHTAMVLLNSFSTFVIRATVVKLFNCKWMMIELRNGGALLEHLRPQRSFFDSAVFFYWVLPWKSSF